METKNILITGITGNVGAETIRSLQQIGSKHQIIAAHYNIEKAKNELKSFHNLSYRHLDFFDPATFAPALKEIDTVFLIRPPQIAEVSKYFAPFLQKCKEASVKEIVFLSVQGAENQSMIPHHKIEKLILARGFDHIFVRPSYFMQNLTTTLLHEIQTEGKIFIPSGKLKFNWVDVRDIGLTTAHFLDDFGQYKNQAYEVTGSEFMGFKEVAKILTKETGKEIGYESPNLLRFFLHKKRQGMKNNMIFVIVMLHFLPRLGKNKRRLTDIVKKVTRKEPYQIRDFVRANKEMFA